MYDGVAVVHCSVTDVPSHVFLQQKSMNRWAFDNRNLTRDWKRLISGETPLMRALDALLELG